MANPSKDEFSRIVESWLPSFVYLQGEQLGSDEIGSLVWNDVDLSLEDLCGLFNTALPTIVGSLHKLLVFSSSTPLCWCWENEFG